MQREQARVLAYYPGCVAKATGKEYDLSTRAVCNALGITLKELDDWNCCGATHCSNELLSVGLSARNLTLTDLPIMVCCSICYSNLRVAALKMNEPAVLSKVNAALEKKYSGARVVHVIEAIEAMLQGEEGKEKIVVPLSGLPIAPYYGCLLTRPGGGIDSPQNPQVLERLIRLLSAKPVSYPCETLCCGGPIFMPQDKAASTTAFQILKKASDAGARAIVTACPLCQLMLDVKQRSLETKAGEKIGLPVLYVTQLAGIALGLGPDELGLGLNSVSPMSLLEEIYKRMAELCRENGK